MYASSSRNAPDVRLGQANRPRVDVCEIGWFPTVEVFVIPCPPPLWPRVKICFIFVRITPPKQTAFLFATNTERNVSVQPVLDAPWNAFNGTWTYDLRPLHGRAHDFDAITHDLHMISRYSNRLIVGERIDVRAYNQLVRALANLRHELSLTLQNWPAADDPTVTPEERKEAIASLTALVHTANLLTNHLATAQSLLVRSRRR